MWNAKMYPNLWLFDIPTYCHLWKWWISRHIWQCDQHLASLIIFIYLLLLFLISLCLTGHGQSRIASVLVVYLYIFCYLNTVTLSQYICFSSLHRNNFFWINFCVLNLYNYGTHGTEFANWWSPDGPRYATSQRSWKIVQQCGMILNYILIYSNKCVCSY